MHQVSNETQMSEGEASTLCWAFLLDQLTLVNATNEVMPTPELATIRKYLWALVKHGPADKDFIKIFVRDAMTSALEISTGQVDPQQAIALLNDRLKVVDNG